MKKSSLTLNILSLIFIGIAGLISLIYFILEFRLLVSGDLAVYANVAAGTFDTIFALLRNTFIIATSVLVYLYILVKKLREKIKYFAIALGFAGILIGIILCILDGLWLNAGIEGYVAVAFKFSLIVGYLLFSINEYRKLKLR